MLTKLALIYLPADMPIAGANCNAIIFQRQMADAGYTATVSKTLQQGLFVDFPNRDGSLLPGADLTVINNLAATHAGGDFEEPQSRAILEEESNSDSPTLTNKLVLDSGLLPEGTYTIHWYMEVALTNAPANPPVTAARGVMLLQIDSGALTERSEINNALAQYQPLSGSFSLALRAGQSVRMQLAFMRVGSTNPVRARRARLVIVLDK